VKSPDSLPALPAILVWFVSSLAWAVAPSGHAASQQGSPAIGSQQIEADWLRQEVLRATAATSPERVTREEDARGACDGVKNGKWGFHTACEDNPWWQIDLGTSVPLDHILLFNRCDSCAGRNARIIVLVSGDAQNWKQVYQHDGTTFSGHTDKKPLRVGMGGVRARYVRLRLPGKSYFHLDEVEVYSSGKSNNIALGKPATQSSTSQWSARHAPVATAPKTYSTARVIARGLQLAQGLRRLGVKVDREVQSLRQVEGQLAKLAKDAPESHGRELYLCARRAVRRMALANPLLDFDTILFVKRAPPMFPHMSDQYYSWWSRPGGGIWLLTGFRHGDAKLRCLTGGWPDGTFLRPDLSYDGKKVLFAYCRYYPHVAAMEKVDKDKLPEDSFYQIYEMNVDGTGRRQLTRGRYDDFDARYLPNGEIVFLSTRKGQFVQCGRATTAATCEGTLSDSYVRCGGGNTRPVAVYTLHVMNADGTNLRPISAFENFEWTPSVAADGRILYARWDYIDRHNGPYMSLWSTNPDGTNPQLVYGNFTVRPQCVFEARPIPNSRKLIFTASAHHSNVGGSLVLLDRTLGTEEARPLGRLTPEVCFPETEGWAEHYYLNPYPLSEEYYLVAWSDRPLPKHTLHRIDDPRNPPNSIGLYLYDAFGNLELLYREPKISSMNPIPVRPRRRPPVFPCTVDWDGQQEGRFLLQDVYRGLEGVARGSVKRLRVVGVPPKTQPQMNSPVLGVSREDPGKFVLGTVPVETDGSAYFRVPSGVPVFFQALDDRGLTVRTMRTLTYVQPNQTLSCIGCHESRETAPAVGGLPLAASRGPSKLAAGPEGSWPLRFDRLVQPVLDKHCVRCHRPDGDDPKAARFDLTASKSYSSLLAFGGDDLKKLALERGRSIVGDCPARQSKLLALLTCEGGHEGVRLDPESFDRLVTWMDVYAQRQGSFDERQEEQLRELRREWADLLASERLGME